MKTLSLLIALCLLPLGGWGEEADIKMVFMGVGVL